MSKVLGTDCSAGGLAAKAAKELAEVDDVCVVDGKKPGGELLKADLKLWEEGRVL